MHYFYKYMSRKKQTKQNITNKQTKEKPTNKQTRGDPVPAVLGGVHYFLF